MKYLAVLFVLLSMSISIHAQSIVRQSSSEMSIEGEPFQLAELGAIVAGDGEKVSFLVVMDGERRPDGYKDIDAKSNDEILMMNGKRIKKTEDLKNAYEALAVGDAVKLGVRRDGKMFIVDFPKIDPANAPKMHFQIATSGGPGGESDILPLPGLHIMLQGEDGSVTVGDLKGMPGEAPEGADFQSDDVIVSINDTAVKTTADFQTVYAALAIGDKVTVQYKRDGETLTAKFNKPKSPGRVMMRRQ